ncbi:putative minor tail protein [Erwinia phage pEa_SNUABM_50]|uniref:Putative minor tail protein n=1 Tax=Erwinia phage pEa_SNUABM_50 TaxID=2768775 RepID=A0A7L8ZP04_9CAUD|nr:putative minor tail protein [Erwinia phage pEa_SNUABM_50]
MSKQIKGSVQVGRYASSQGRNLVRTLNGLPFDGTGNLEINAYTKDEFEKIISVLPLSHYGSFSFLPAGVYGSFEGASDVPSYRYRRIHVENDGTLIILRPGTNGAKRGLYYSYLDNILTTTSLNNAINSNKEYKPGYFGSSYTAKMAYASDSRVVAGLAQNNAGENYTFISWANNTLNDAQHVGSIVPSSIIQPNSGSMRFVMTGNTEIFFFVEVSTGNNLIMEVRSVPISQIQESATTLTVTEYPNWTTNSFYGNVYTNQNIVLNNNKMSSVASDQPYVLIPAGGSGEPYMTGVDIYAAQNASGMIRLRVVGDCYCTTQTANIRPKHSYSFLLNPATKVATLEAGNTAPLTITQTGNNMSVTGNTYTTDPILTVNGGRGNQVMAYYYFNNGTTIGIGSQNLGSAPTYIMRANYPNATSIYDTLQVRNHTSTNWLLGSMKTSYGSPVGAEVMGYEWVTGNRYKVASWDANSQYRLSLNQTAPTPTFTFGSVGLGTIKGFQPTTNRKFIDNTNDNKLFISTISGSTVTTNGGVFVESIKLSSPLSYDQDLNTSGSMSISNTLLQTLKNQQLANATIPVDLNNKSTITLYVPQQSDIPAFALISGITPTFSNYMKIIEVNVNTRTGVISTLTFKRLVYEGGNTIGGFSSDATYGLASGAVGLTIYDAGSFYFIGGVDPYMYKTLGDSNSTTWRAKVTKSTQQMDSFVISGSYQHHTPGNGQLPWAVPGVGFGYIDFTLNAGDDRVRTIFQPIGTTLAQYNAWTDTGSPILLAGQDVAQGFVIYFTENTPVLLSGKSFTMPIQNIDLTTVKANPANSTFYIYVTMKEGLAQYLATETVIAETGTTAYNTLWIGTVTTNAIQIDTINILKRSRLDVFGASLEAAGSSFPVSYGLPSATGIINW